MADARILAAADAAVALILAGWEAWDTPPSGSDAVQFGGAPTISFTPDIPPQIAGRQVYVFIGQSGTTNFTRGDRLWEGRIQVLVVEQYSAAEGDPPNAWLRERLNFCDAVIFRPLTNPSLLLVDEMFPALEEQATVDIPYDRDALRGGDKAFWSVMTFPFQEDTDLSGGVSL